MPADLNQPVGSAADSSPTHALSAEDFASLAAGPGSVRAVTTLAQARLSATRILIAKAAREAGGWRNPRLQDAAQAGWDLLCRLDAEERGAVNEAFTHPYAYAWAVRCLIPPPDADRDLDRAHLAGLAAAAAVGAGVAAELPLPVREGKVHIPAVGTLMTGAGAAPIVNATIRDGRVAAGEHGTWQPTRELATAGFRIRVEDLDPFRDCQDWPATGRLSDGEWRNWRRGLRGLGTRLSRTVPSYAKAVKAGLRAIVPLRPEPTAQRSGSASQAFGAVAVALPDRPSDLDTLVVHEFQHVKMHALLEMHQLVDGDATQRLRVPWRRDARPLNAVLHGVYAHLALTHLSEARGPAERHRYLKYRTWVRETIAALSATGSLTGDGERFVHDMLAAVEARRGT